MNFLKIVFALVIVSFILLAAALFSPWQKVNWGKISLAPAETVTVVGTAKQQQQSQIAVFNAGVNVVSDNKQAATDEVNQKINALTKAVKDFGIKEADIKTQNLNVYQREETYYEEGRQKSRPGQWTVGTTIEIKLRDVNRASALADLLTQSGATNVYGPNFSVDQPEEADNTLLDAAIKNAQEKAEVMAKSSHKKLGKVLTISEGFSSGAVLPALKGAGAGGGGAGLEPGSQTLEKSVTVTFELD